MSLSTDDIQAEEGPAELVHWMEPGPVRLERAGVAGVVVAAFALGVAAAAGAYYAFRWIGPRKEGLPPWRWRRGKLH
jgi:hypothetical protein